MASDETKDITDAEVQVPLEVVSLSPPSYTEPDVSDAAAAGTAPASAGLAGPWAQLLASNASRVRKLRALRLARKCIMNVLQWPDNNKYRKINLGNTKVQQIFGGIAGVVDVLCLAGFKRVIPTDNSSQGHLVLTQEDTNLTWLCEVAAECETHITELVNQLEHSSTPPVHSSSSAHSAVPSSAGSSNASTTDTGALPDIYRSRLKRKSAKTSNGNKATVPRKLSRSALAAKVEARLSGSRPQASADANIIQGKVTDFKHNAKLQRDLRDVRRDKHQQWRRAHGGKQRVYTVADLERLQQERQTVTASFSTHNSKTRKEWDEIGKQALKFTNEFRAQHNLPALSWHQALCDIGYKHSEDMGLDKMPFSHKGFDARVKLYPFAHRGAAENLALMNGHPNVARAAVDGWIKSPGHCKNLLSKQTFCGIGVYRNAKGTFYLTQLFALT